MRMPFETASVQVLRNLSRYTLARLKAEAETSGLAVGLDKALEEVLAAAAARDKTRDAATAALAARDACDYKLDQLVVQASMATLVALKNQRSAPAYKRLFPRGAGGLTTLPPLDEIAAVRSLLVSLDAEPAEAPARPYAEGIKAAVEALEAAVVAYSAAVAEDGRVRAREVGTRDTWRRVYRKIYGELIVLYPDGRTWAESFFRSPAPDRSNTPTEPTEPAPVG